MHARAQQDIAAHYETVSARHDDVSEERHCIERYAEETENILQEDIARMRVLSRSGSIITPSEWEEIEEAEREAERRRWEDLEEARLEDLRERMRGPWYLRWSPPLTTSSMEVERLIDTDYQEMQEDHVHSSDYMWALDTPNTSDMSNIDIS